MRNLKALVSVAMIAISMTGVAATKSNAVKRNTKKDREPAVGMAIRLLFIALKMVENQLL